jgi:hypothetical protein
MPVIRATFFFEQAGYGWTETFWTNAASITDPGLLAKSDKLANKRIKMCGLETRMTYVRHSVDGVFRDAKFHGYTGGGLQGDVSNSSDAPTTALLCYQRNAQGNGWRNIYLRGCWDGVVTLGGAYNPTPLFLTRFDDWQTAVIGDQWGWMTANERLIANVLTVVADPTGVVNVTVDDTLFSAPFNKNDSVFISGVLGAAAINGEQTIRTTGEKAFQTRKRIPIFPYQSGGRVTKTLTTFTPISGIGITRVCERKVGRPSFKSRGRRPVRAVS